MSPRESSAGKQASIKKTFKSGKRTFYLAVEMTDEEWLEQAADRGSADIKDQIVTGILNEVCEYFAFDEEEVR